MQRAPPHARRSTPGAPGDRGARVGSSARAEVYLMSTVETSAPAGLLRTRGGLPFTAKGARLEAWAPPHARRSTSCPRSEAKRGRGSSARAEVYLMTGSLPESRSRLLRTRGGLPCLRRRKPLRSRAPPHARRSTRQPVGPRAGVSGSSARAEVYPRWCALLTCCWRLLRTRGGLPQSAFRKAFRAKAPPHARRSTQ